MSAVTCPGCSRVIQTMPEDAGGIIECVKCGQRMQIPTALPVDNYAGPGAFQQSFQVNPTINVDVDVGRRPFPHVLHLVITILTCGFWAPVWIVHYLFSR